MHICWGKCEKITSTNLNFASLILFKNPHCLQQSEDIYYLEAPPPRFTIKRRPAACHNYYRAFGICVRGRRLVPQRRRRRRRDARIDLTQQLGTKLNAHGFPNESEDPAERRRTKPSAPVACVVSESVGQSRLVHGIRYQWLDVRTAEAPTVDARCALAFRSRSAPPQVTSPWRIEPQPSAEDPSADR